MGRGDASGVLTDDIVHTVGVFPFGGDQLLVEKLYADMSPLLPHLDFLE